MRSTKFDCLFMKKIMGNFTYKTLKLVFILVPMVWTTVEFPGYDLTADVNFVILRVGWVGVEH